MDRPEYRTLVEALGAVPDPRQRRGQRYRWELLLVLIAAAVVSGQTHVRGIGQWVGEHAEELREALDRPGQRLPSEATLRRAIQAVDPLAVEQCLGRFGETTAAQLARGSRLQGLALDGKEVRGARAHGRVVHLLGLASHDGVLLAQTEVADHANEITAAPALLAGRDLAGTVTTTDALLSQRALARQIRAQGGHYLMVVKDNHPEVAGPIAHLFAEPPWLPAERPTEYAMARTLTKGHGRLETRTLEASPTLNTWLDWPDVGQVLRRTCRRVRLTTGAVSEASTVAITSLRPDAANPAQLEALWRGHWTVENRVHWVRDVTMGEDAGQGRVGGTPRTLAALRGALLGLLRGHGWTRIADALRHYAAGPERALTLIGAIPNRL